MRRPPLIVRSRNGAEIQTDSGKLIDFTAWDTFGIAAHPHVRAAAHSAMERFGVHSVSSSARTGRTDIHQLAEETIASKLAAERAVLFPSRSQAMISLITAGVNLKGGPLIVDSSVSSPALDACHLAEIPSGRSDLRAANIVEAPRGHESLLGSAPHGVAVIEPVSKIGFHIPNISILLHKLTIPIIADETFSFGLTGLLGVGNFPPPVLNCVPLARVVGFESSLGLPCCAIVGNANVIDGIAISSASLSGELGVSPAEAASVVSGLEILERMTGRREELALRSSSLITGLASVGLKAVSSEPVPIIALQFASRKVAREFCSGLASRGFVVDELGCLTPLSPLAYVRISLNVAHTATQLEQLVRNAMEISKKVQPPH